MHASEKVGVTHTAPTCAYAETPTKRKYQAQQSELCFAMTNMWRQEEAQMFAPTNCCPSQDLALHASLFITTLASTRESGVNKTCQYQITDKYYASQARMPKDIRTHLGKQSTSRQLQRRIAILYLLSQNDYTIMSQ